MMPVQDMATQPIPQSPGVNPGQSIAGEHVNYKKKYKALKKKMRMLVYEQECFSEELKKAQRKLLKVSRDRSFLLDRLLNYEKLDDSSDDTDATASSDSEAETKEPMTKKRKVPNQAPLSLSGAGISLLPGNLNKQQASWLMQMSGAADKVGRADGTTKCKTTKGSRKSNKSASQDSGTGSGSSATGQMTREELERHLELKQSAKPQYMSVEKTPYSLPDDIFCNDNSNQDGEALEVKKEDVSILGQFLHMPR